jgi:hypothetical protein
MSNPYGQNPESNSGENQPSSGDQPSYGQTPPPPPTGDTGYGQSQPSAGEPSYGQNEPPTYGEQPPTYGQQPPAYGEQPPAYGQQPPSYGQQPPAYGEQQPAYGQQPGYGQNPYGGYAAVGQAHPQGVAVLVLGILGIVVCGICAVIAWVMGNKAIKEIDANPTAYNNRQMVNVGRILGMVGTIIWGAFIVIYVVVIIVGVVAAQSGR